MPMDTNTIFEEALKMPADLRGKLAAGLLDSLDDGVDADYEEAWAEEIQRRIDDVRSNPESCVSWEEARKLIMSEDDSD